MTPRPPPSVTTNRNREPQSTDVCCKLLCAVNIVISYDLKLLCVADIMISYDLKLLCVANLVSVDNKILSVFASNIAAQNLKAKALERSRNLFTF